MGSFGKIQKRWRNAHETKWEVYSKIVDELLSKCMTTVTDPLPKNKRPLFSYPAVKGTSKSLQLLSMKSEYNLFSRLYLACQA